ncbi:hypothetical protein DI09_209p10, partial [Mitosporidium daphniae]
MAIVLKLAILENLNFMIGPTRRLYFSSSSSSCSSSSCSVLRLPLKLHSLEGKYASALFSSCMKTKSLEPVSKALLSLHSLFTKNSNETCTTLSPIGQKLCDPTLSIKDKRKIVDMIGKTLSPPFIPIFGNFLYLLIENGRLQMFPKIMLEWSTLLKSHKNEIDVTIISAIPLQAEYFNSLKSKLVAKFISRGTSAHFFNKVDPAILGGFIINFGDKNIDMSVSSRMNNLEKMVDFELSNAQLLNNAALRYNVCRVKRNAYSMVHQVGSLIHGWKVIESERIPQFGATVTSLQHLQTGSKFCNIYRADASNVFSVAFPTAPQDNTGAPHILEHTVLCGSKKYPVRDPFYKMLNRSLSSYMNAWTSSTFTMYPFSIPAGNVADIKNLRSVYFDALFNPLLRKLDFLQEGWRTEIDEHGSLKFKGVVYNEMKGAFSDADDVFSSKLFRSLLPENKESGGDPALIPHLTYENLVAFYQNCYHPSNAYFLAYGTHPLEDHLLFISEQFSASSVCRPVLANIGKEGITGLPDNLDEFPKNICASGPCDPLGLEPDYQGRYIKSWLTNDLSDPSLCTKESLQLAFDLSSLSSLLLDGPSSPMYKALIDGGLSRTGEYCPSGYNSYSSRLATFGIGLSGVNVKSNEELEAINLAITSTLEAVERDGFSSKRVDALLHMMELSLSHTSANFGLGLAQRIIQAWITINSSPIELMKIHDRMDQLRSSLRISDGAYFRSLIRQYLLDNRRVINFSMEADPNYLKLESEKETQLLKTLESSLDKNQVLIEAKELKEDQNKIQGTFLLSPLNCRQ